MTLSRTTFFCIVLIIVLAPVLIPKVWWLAHSSTAKGIMRFVGKEYTGQLVHQYSVISFEAAKDTFWFNSSDNTIFAPGAAVPVLYETNDPADAKVDIFSNIWADTLVYGAAPLIITLMIFFHPKGLSKNVKFLLSFKRPFIKVIPKYRASKVVSS